MTDTFQLTPSESVRILRDDAGGLEVEGTWGPGGSPPPSHFHPTQDERFEVLEIPRGAVHQMWNPAEAPARATWRTSPAGRTRQWFADIDALLRSGRVGGNGMPGPLAFGAYLTEFRDVFRLAGPQPVLVPLVKGLGALGRLKGYRPTRA